MSITWRPQPSSQISLQGKFELPISLIILHILTYKTRCFITFYKKQRVVFLPNPKGLLKMKRFASRKLDRWLTNPNRKPMVIRDV
jgi:hypothetical protein